MKKIKLKIRYIFFSALLVVFSGCSNSAFNYFDKEEPFVNNAKHTQVLKVVENDIVKAIVNITYLNAADEKKWTNKKQNFIIGKYIVEESDSDYSFDLQVEKKKKIQLDENKIEYETVSLQPSSEKTIKKSDSIYTQIPFKNSWAEYTLVTYEDFGEEIVSFKLIFKDNKGNFSQTQFKKR